MAFSIHGTLLYSLGLLLAFWIPAVVLLFSSYLLVTESRRRQLHNRISNTTKSLLLVCAVLWFFLFAEYHITHRIALFDLGAPLFSLIAFFVIPFLLPVSLSTEIKRSHPRKPYLLSGAFFLLAAISMIPGIYLVWYYTSAIVFHHS